MGYFLDEDNNWALDMNEIQKSYDQGIAEGAEPRAIVVINPGNPTGNVLSKKNLEDVIKFAHEKKLFLFADEVYQVCRNYLGTLLGFLENTPEVLTNIFDLFTFLKCYFRIMYTQMDANSIHSKRW